MGGRASTLRRNQPEGPQRARCGLGLFHLCAQLNLRSSAQTPFTLHFMHVGQIGVQRAGWDLQMFKHCEHLSEMTCRRSTSV